MELHRWREILSPYHLAVKELDVKFNHIIEECRAIGRYSVIERVHCRLKTVASILDKARRKDIDIENVCEEITDIAGVRLICQFEEDIAEVVELIRKRPDMEIIEEKNYLEDAKQSGYRSYHIIVNYEVFTIWGPKMIPVEIQIRTMAMNFWSTIEHSLQYKYEGNVPEFVRERLKSSAEAVNRMDKEMSAIREDIVTSQDIFFLRAQIVRDINNSIANLYNFEDRAAIKNIQDEFLSIYKRGTLDELKEFQRKLDVIAARHGAQEI